MDGSAARARSRICGDVADHTGGYYFNMNSHEPADYAKKSDVAERLWQASEALTGMAR